VLRSRLAIVFAKKKRFTFLQQILFANTRHGRALLCINAAMVYFNICIIYGVVREGKTNNNYKKAKNVQKYANYDIVFMCLAPSHPSLSWTKSVGLCHLEGN